MSLIDLEPITRDERIHYILFLLAVTALLYTECMSMWHVSFRIGLISAVPLIMRHRRFCFHYVQKSQVLLQGSSR